MAAASKTKTKSKAASDGEVAALAGPLLGQLVAGLGDRIEQLRVRDLQQGRRSGKDATIKTTDGKTFKFIFAEVADKE